MECVSPELEKPVVAPTISRLNRFRKKTSQREENIRGMHVAKTDYPQLDYTLQSDEGVNNSCQSSTYGPVVEIGISRRPLQQKPIARDVHRANPIKLSSGLASAGKCQTPKPYVALHHKERTSIKPSVIVMKPPHSKEIVSLKKTYPTQVSLRKSLKEYMLQTWNLDQSSYKSSDSSKSSGC